MKRNPEVAREILKEFSESEFNHFEAKLARVDGPLEKGTETDSGKANQIRAEHIRWLLDLILNSAQIHPHHQHLLKILLI